VLLCEWNAETRDFIKEKSGRYILVNKTMAYDTRYEQLRTRRFYLPRNARGIPDYYDQMLAPVRVRKEKTDGSVIYIYDNRNLADHYSAAAVYATVAYALAKRRGADRVFDYDAAIAEFAASPAELASEKAIARTDELIDVTGASVEADELTEAKRREIEEAQRTLAAFRALMGRG
jgi:hypothetical protein